MERYEKIVQEFCQCPGWSDEMKLKIMELERFDRITEALEGISMELSGINDHLESIDNNLDSCIARNGNNHFFCVTGNFSSN